MVYMSASDFDAILDFLELDDRRAALAFGVHEAEIRLMKSGALKVPFYVSAMTVLMCESEKATRIAVEHGYAMRHPDPSLKALLADAIGVKVGAALVPTKRPTLKLVGRSDGDQS